MSAFSRREFLATLSALGMTPSAFAIGRDGQLPTEGAGPSFLHGV